jgi:Ulp1 family protease
MATIEHRLQVLESRNAINKNNLTDIILVGFVGKDELESPINHIWQGEHNFYKTNGETEEEFKERASNEIRKIKRVAPNCILLLFGK